jgi:hypothetical protein
VERALERAAAVEGRVLVASPGRMPLLWAVVNGVGDQLIDSRHHLHDCTRDEFLSFASDGLVEALTRPARVGD